MLLIWILSSVYEANSPMRPQNPVPPYPYISEEVEFRSQGLLLKGTLTRPKLPGQHKALVLITGSGPQNRDEEILGHKPFLVLSDHLSRQGFVVLRYDERGVGESEGDFSKATSQDFMFDALSAWEYLRSQDFCDPQQTGLLGHSEGGMVSIMAAAKEQKIAFLILLAASVHPLSEILYDQRQRAYNNAGIPKDHSELLQQSHQRLVELATSEADELQILRESVYLARISLTVSKPLNKEERAQRKQNLLQLSRYLQAVYKSPWMRFVLKFDPVHDLKKVSCPVLALNGELDTQIPAKASLDLIKTALTNAGNHNVTVHSLPNLNHLFQKAVSGEVSEYATIEETINPTVLKIITDWL
ncbi:MAG: alpha/beta fold hydrolase [Candidatus Cloacimonetes bacterium]|nr:alpha/beta fold hydrolase [Candidatus Cloacimonadota bacterium]